MKQLIQTTAYHLQDEVLAMHLQLLVESIMKVLVYVYVAGVITGEVVRPYVTRIGEMLSYRIPPTGEDRRLSGT